MSRILVADDEEGIRRLLRRTLERNGHTVTEAVDVTEAAERLATEPFDLLLCDINMPGGSGLDLVRQVDAELPNTVVMMVTGVDDPAVAEEAMAMGAYGYMVKPFKANEAVIHVAGALRRRELELAQRRHFKELESKVASGTTALRQALSRLERTEETARSAERETADRLVTALVLATEETEGHIERMSRYAAALAERRGLDAWTSEEFRLAASLHDIGKIGVPAAILLKPGPLTEEEFEVVRRHPNLAAELLTEGTSQTSALGARIALTHHERWDGAGYPTGLAGEAIPVEGRIAAVADAFDALTSDRVYRRALPVEEALTVLRAERGAQFDPALLDLFEESIDEMLAIREAYPDPPPPEGGITVLVADPRRMFAHALGRMLDDAAGLTVSALAETAAGALDALRQHAPDVAVLAADLPDRDGVDLATQIRAEAPSATVILLAARDDEELLLRALDAGCSGLVLRDRAFEELAPAVAAARAGEPLVPAARLMTLFGRRRGGRSSDSPLTRREVEILQLVAEGLSNDAVAERLVLSVNTVRNHVQNILTRLGAHSRLEAVTIAVRQGIIAYR
ncbi:MAG: response regulator [Actinobacteria bacterium]|nr:response regulator [Actinomycetota bacterium]